MRSKTMFVILAVFVLGSWLDQPKAWAQKEKPYPTRQISYLICFDPGGQSDRVARLQQPHLDRILGQKVIFITRPISAVFIGLAILSLVRGVWKQMKSHAPEIAEEDMI
jgi:tripartite-type tricarboxylate transporter receptor subunit TctC